MCRQREADAWLKNRMDSQGFRSFVGGSLMSTTPAIIAISSIISCPPGRAELA
jgi:hypothetical protein